MANRPWENGFAARTAFGAPSAVSYDSARNPCSQDTITLAQECQRCNVEVLTSPGGYGNDTSNIDGYITGLVDFCE
ncbi:hypothetical protein RQP46_002810 [Phenoliferia psychrophenolica]